MPPALKLHPMIFQSTCLREARRSLRFTTRNSIEFQSTCLREARPGSRYSRCCPWYFNPRAYVRHDMMYRKLPAASIFQSTCLREARRALAHVFTGGCISIHVPT